MKHGFPKLIACVAVLVVAFALSAAQAAELGKATVRSITGAAQYAEGGAWMDLKVGQVLRQGAVIRTANDSEVGLNMGVNGPTVLLKENTTLGIDKLTFEDTGTDTVIETQLDLKSGRIVGYVRKLAATSKYEVKMPNGVAGIRGTEYVISATGEVCVISGSVVVVFVKSDGTVITQVVNAGDCFIPATGRLEPMPSGAQSDALADLRRGREEVAPAVPEVEPITVFVSPTVGASSGDGNGEGGPE
jgi:hypothetical protein